MTSQPSEKVINNLKERLLSVGARSLMDGPPADPPKKSKSRKALDVSDVVFWLLTQGFVLKNPTDYTLIDPIPETALRLTPHSVGAFSYYARSHGALSLLSKLSLDTVPLGKIVPWLQSFGEPLRIIQWNYTAITLEVGDVFHIVLEMYNFKNISKVLTQTAVLFMPEAYPRMRDWLHSSPRPISEKSAPEVAVMIQRPDGSLGLKTVSLVNVKSTIKDTDLDLVYGTGMLEFHKDLVSRLKKERGGLTILHGDPGGGKTSYIRHLMKALKGKKQLVLLPKGVLEVLGTPKFIEFLIDLSTTPSVLVIEDAEDVVMTGSRAQGSATSTLLNLTDGILNDISSVQVLITFNCPVSKVDPALMRSGRLTAKRDFGPLSVADAIRLAETKGLQTDHIKKPMMLCDILCSPPVSSAASTGRSSTTGTAKVGFV